MSTFAQLKTASAKLAMTADALEAAAADLDNAAKSRTKTASDSQEAVSAALAKVAADAKAAEDARRAQLGTLAKTASSKLREVGLLSNQEQADVFASQILDHDKALHKLAQLTQFVTGRKLGSVEIEGASPEVKTAYDAYDEKARAVLQRFNID